MRVWGVLIAAAVLIVLVAPASAPPVQAQTGGVCAQLVEQAFTDLGSSCANQAQGSLCYGFSPVEADLADGAAFDQPGSRAALADVQSVHTGGIDVAAGEWGIASLKVQANLPTGEPDAAAVLLMVGDVTVSDAVDPDLLVPAAEPVAVTTSVETNLRAAPGLNAQIMDAVPGGTDLMADGVSPDEGWARVAVPVSAGASSAAWVKLSDLDAPDVSGLPTIDRYSLTPMQSFTFETAMDTPPCIEAPPSVLIVQGPEGVPVDIIANGAHIRVESTIFLRTLPGNLMELTTFLGRAIIDPGMQDQLVIPAGSRITAPLGPNGHLAGVWDGWRLLQQTEIDLFGPLENLPINIMHYPIVRPRIILPSGVGQPRPQVHTPHGTFTPWPPHHHTFPRIQMITGTPGQDLPREAWQAVAVGDAVCNEWALFQSNVDGDWDVYRLDLDGQVTNMSRGSGSSDVQSSYSVDGQWVAWVTNRDGLANWEIWVSRSDGTQPRRVTFNTAADINPVWGPGNQIVFESNRDGNWELYLLDVNGDGVPVRLTDDSASDINAFWTPDGQSIYFQSDRDGNWEIYRLDFGPSTDPTGNVVTRITNNDLEDQMPVVSHDGKLLAWLQQDDFGFYNLMLMTLETGEVRQMTDTGSDIGGVVFAPDDSYLAFHTNLDGDFDIYAVEVASGMIKDVTANSGQDLAPAFVCGSAQLFFQSDRNATLDFPGEYELFQTNPLPLDAPAGSASALTDGPESDELFPNGMDREERNTRAGQIPAHQP